MDEDNVVFLDDFAIIPEENESKVINAPKEFVTTTGTNDASATQETPKATITVWTRDKTSYLTLLTLPDGRCLRFHYDKEYNLGVDVEDVEKIANFFGYECTIEEPIKFSLELQRELIDKHLMTLL
jgi:hypothetical protein